MKFLFPFVFFSAIAFSAYVKRNAKNDLDITMEILNKERKANTTGKTANHGESHNNNATKIRCGIFALQ